MKIDWPNLYVVISSLLIFIKILNKDDIWFPIIFLTFGFIFSFRIEIEDNKYRTVKR